MISNKCRWLAVGTGLFTAVANIPAFGLGSLLFLSSFLIIGAIVQHRFPRAGRGLICAGAIWLTFWVFDLGILMVVEKASGYRLPVLGALVILTSVSLAVWCDIVIVAEELRIRRLERGSKQLSEKLA